MTESLDFPRPLSSVDLAIFALRDAQLHVLLVKRPSTPAEPFPGLWALPGGFVDVARDASLEACAERKLKDKTGVAAPYLEQVGSFGSARRDPRGWSATHVYFALLPHSDVPLRAGGNASDAQWFALHGTRVRERLAFDHAELLKAALLRLRSKVEYTSLPAYLLADEFTFPELQRVYEMLLDRALDKKAFRTRILATDLLQEVPRQRSTGSRPAQLYRLKNRRRPVFFARALATGA
jgi:ADP-ribose pyrophosphatase YjhB (NUDIX family)